MSSMDTGKTATIISAVLDELARLGYGRMSMEAVARRAGVGKSALYRRWPSKQEMVVSVLSEMSIPPSTAIPDTGLLRADLVLALGQFVGWLTDPRLATILPDLSAEAARNPEFAVAYQAQIARPRRAIAATILRRAVIRGEISADLDLDLAIDLVSAPLYWRLNIRQLSIPPGYVEEVVEHGLRALMASDARTDR